MRNLIYESDRFHLIEGNDRFLGRFYQLYDKTCIDKSSEGEGLIFDYSEVEGVSVNLEVEVESNKINSSNVKLILLSHIEGLPIEIKDESKEDIDVPEEIELMSVYMSKNEILSLIKILPDKSEDTFKHLREIEIKRIESDPVLSIMWKILPEESKNNIINKTINDSMNDITIFDSLKKKLKQVVK
jgi:hypothetical protein